MERIAFKNFDNGEFKIRTTKNKAYKKLFDLEELNTKRDLVIHIKNPFEIKFICPRCNKNIAEVMTLKPSFCIYCGQAISIDSI